MCFFSSSLLLLLFLSPVAVHCKTQRATFYVCAAFSASSLIANTPLKATCMRGAWPQSSQVGTVTDRITNHTLAFIFRCARCPTESINFPLTKSRCMRTDEGKARGKTADKLGWVVVRNTQPMPLTSWCAAILHTQNRITSAKMKASRGGKYQASSVGWWYVTRSPCRSPRGQLLDVRP